MHKGSRDLDKQDDLTQHNLRSPAAQQLPNNNFRSKEGKGTLSGRGGSHLYSRGTSKVEPM